MHINQNAPVVQQNERFIAASPEKVWAVLTDINNWTSWHPKISRAKMTGEALPGTTFEWKANGASIKSVLQTVEPYRSLGWSGTTFGGSAIHNWQLEPQDSGTLVHVGESMEGWLIQLFKKKMNRDLAADMAFWLERLKAASEGAA